jgi:serine/threonine protein kinase
MTERDIFIAALQREDPARRQAYLDQACARKPELRSQVEHLLWLYDGAGSFLEKPAATAQATGAFQQHAPEPASPGEAAGARIGPYQLLEPIGEGGMGSVWMAQQTEPVKRLVAIKLIKAGMDSALVIARFEAERQALALMDHANIARVLDAGTTLAGWPYFVMDLVKGMAITRYCDEHHLTPRQRLELFLPVCQAVQHAHQKGIIHRDLKPSNVLVALYDGQPVPKVIDFGVAKAAGQTLTEKTLVTGFGAIVGTLEYMSAEQAEVNQFDIDTRSDIYSLGVLLYEQLTGSPPFSRKDKTGVLEMLRVIREQEPTRPSAKLSTAEGLPTLAANRGTEPAKLTRLVRGELDWIVLKALEKDRGRRYETANGFAMDIQRYLRDEPVLAGPPSATYRLRKFVRRNRGVVLAASLVVLTLLLGILGTTVGLVLAEQARQAEADQRVRAEGERDDKERARKAAADAAAAEKSAKEQAQRDRDAKEQALQKETQERKYAQAIADFVTHDFLALTSVEGQDRFAGISTVRLDKDAPLRQLLDRAAEKLNERTDLNSRIEAELRWMIGVNYRGLGETALAIPFLERCLALRKELVGPDHEETLNAQNSLAVALGSAGQYDLAVQLYEDVLKLRKAKLGADHADTLASINNLAVGYDDAGKLELALPLYEETLKVRTAKFGADHPDTLMSMNNLAEGYLAAGKLELALPLLQEAAAGVEKRNFQHHHAHAIVNNVIACHEELKQFDQAEPWHRKWLAVVRKQAGTDSGMAVSWLTALGWNLLQQQKWTDAEVVLRECLALRAKLQPGSWTMFSTQSMLGGALLGQKKYADAEPLLLNGYAGLKQRAATIPLPGKIALTETLTRLVQLYEATGKTDDAAKWRDVLQQHEGTLVGPVHDVGDGLTREGKLDGKTATLVYQVKLNAGKVYVIDMISPDPKALDPYLVLKTADGRYLAEDDDSGGNLNARIVYRALSDGVYRIHATSFNAGSGAFTLTVREKQ